MTFNRGISRALHHSRLPLSRTCRAPEVQRNPLRVIPLPGECVTLHDTLSRIHTCYVIAIFREIRGSTRAILPQSKERPRGSRASSGTAVEDCSIHGQDNSAKGAREKRMRRSAPHGRRSKVHMYLRVWRSDGPRLCIFGKTSAYIFERGGARTGGWTRLFPPRDRSKGGLLEAIIEAPLYTCAPFLSLLLRSLSLSLSRFFSLFLSDATSGSFAMIAWSCCRSRWIRLFAENSFSPRN